MLRIFVRHSYFVITRLRNFYRNFLLPTGLLAGTIIGAGVFALPFIFKVAGLLTGFFYLLLATVIYVLIHLFFADTIIRTPGEHRFVGYTRIYLGRTAGWISVLMAVLEMVFVLTIYLVLSVSFINLFLPNLPDLWKLLIFWVLGSATIFLSLKKLTFLEFSITIGMILIIIMTFVLGLGKLGKIGLNDFYPNFEGLLFPLGPLLFALGGRVAIPYLVKYFHLPNIGHQHRFIRRSIIWGTVIPAIVYGFFILGVLGLSRSVTEDSISGLVGAVPGGLLAVLGVLGFLTLWSSYIVIGLDVKSVLLHDLKFSRAMRIAIVVLAPLALYFLGFQNFIGLVSFVGGIFLAVEGIFITLMWLKANRVISRKPDVVSTKSVPLAFLTIFILSVTLIFSIFKFY